MFHSALRHQIADNNSPGSKLKSHDNINFTSDESPTASFIDISVHVPRSPLVSDNNRNGNVNRTSTPVRLAVQPTNKENVPKATTPQNQGKQVNVNVSKVLSLRNTPSKRNEWISKRESSTPKFKTPLRTPCPEEKDLFASETETIPPSIEAIQKKRPNSILSLGTRRMKQRKINFPKTIETGTVAQEKKVDPLVGLLVF